MLLTVQLREGADFNITRCRFSQYCNIYPWESPNLALQSLYLSLSLSINSFLDGIQSSVEAHLSHTSHISLR